MILKGLVDEDIANYKKTSMFLIFPFCTFKCEKDCGKNICQNSSIVKQQNIEVTPETLCERYLHNPLTSAVVCGGLEPFDSRFDLLSFVNCLRIKYSCEDDIVIYTGYTEEELNNPELIEQHFIFENLKSYSNIIVKFGRYIPDQEGRFDEVLGVTLASKNQYAKRLINEL